MKRNIKRTYRAIVWDVKDKPEPNFSEGIRGLRLFKNKRYYEIMERNEK